MSLIGKKILEKCWGNGKRYPWAEDRICIFVCRVEKKISFSLEITVIIFKACEKLFWFKQDFNSAELLTKASFFLYFRDRTKNGEGNKGDVESICARVAKMYQNTWWKLRLIRIDYEQLIMDCFHCIFKSMDNLAHLIPVLWFVSWFLCFLQHLLQE